MKMKSRRVSITKTLLSSVRRVKNVGSGPEMFRGPYALASRNETQSRSLRATYCSPPVFEIA